MEKQERKNGTNRNGESKYKVHSNHKAGETNVDATYQYTSGNPTPDDRKGSNHGTV